MIPPGPGVFSRAIDGELYVWNIATAPICTLATILRFYATRRAGRKIDREDWFALGALLIHLVYVIILTYDVAYINGRQFELIPPNQVIYIGKLTYASIPMFPVQQFFAKFSILFLYYRLFSINKTFVKCMYLVGSLQIIYSVMTLFVSLFLCTPIERSWNPLVPGHCINHNQYLAGSETVNSSVDLAMILMACFMVWHLRMKKALKWKLVILFVIGGVSGIIGFVKIGQTYKSTSTLNLESGLWTTIQQATSCICCCAPIYGSLLPNTEWARRHFGVGHSSRRSQDHPPGKELDMISSSEERMSHPPPAVVHNSPSAAVAAWDELGLEDPRGQAWTEVDATPSHHGSHGDTTPPSRTIRVENTVEMA